MILWFVSLAVIFYVAFLFSGWDFCYLLQVESDVSKFLFYEKRMYIMRLVNKDLEFIA